MIVQDIMSTKPITIAPDDTLAHAVNLLRQHGFHHLPVARVRHVADEQQTKKKKYKTLHLLEGMLTSQDIDLQAMLARQEASSRALQRSWLERRVVEVMHRALIRVQPTTSVSSAVQIMVERNLNYLPVVTYEQIDGESKALLEGLVTRSDLLLAFSRAMGATEPGMQLVIMLPLGDSLPLARFLEIASQMHVYVRSVLAAPTDGGVPTVATIRLGTINPAPLLLRLQQEGIHYSIGASPMEGDMIDA
ncbi:CBS domain-containing protein [Ktedonospora formicarum]|uniref:CBS domain-containing protein n=1 Tax=Ktedonospora formicarum TaxID=2778364 RepID=A0A8J3HXT3_9CHLR|nr:CBS domain-containing protein [Ktedonospora formicarum]GHO42923.1 CBS domain-containing protein [Ktedonospora formicarum]